MESRDIIWREFWDKLKVENGQFNGSEINGSMVQDEICCIRAPYALGIGAASFAKRSDNGASKDRAESPTAELERPKQNFRILEF